MSQVAVAAATREARKSRGLRQADLARETHVDRTYISHLENERIANNPEVLKQVAELLDCGWLYKALHEATASLVFVHRKLDGELVDLHRSSVVAKTIEELDEAITSLRGFNVINKPGEVTDEDREEIITGIMTDLLGAECAIETLVTVLCREYGISPSDVYERFNARLQDKGYQQRR